MPARVLPVSEGSDAAVEAASQALAAGEIVAIPTETVYGLAADAANGPAVARVFEAKGRPTFNPLICHVSGQEMAERYGILDERARLLAERFWPGPLTLVVPLCAGAPVHPLVTSGLRTIALRAPRGVAAEVIRALGRAIAAPSANRSGRLSATLASHVAEQLGELIPLVLDAGPSPVGVESTIVDVSRPTARLLRPGGVAAEEIEAALGRPLDRRCGADGIVAPGMMASHYAPRVPVRPAARNVESGEAFLGFGGFRPEHFDRAVATLDLSESGNLVEAAANLFAYLAELDQSGASVIAVAPIPSEGLGEAINDRLARAAAPRPTEK